MSLSRAFFSTAAKKPRFRSALRKLSEHGVEALKPQLIVAKDPQLHDDRWRSPAISSRIARVIRKEAIRDGTYGSFDPEKGGWDPAWDVDLAKSKAGGQGRMTSLRAPKKHSRQRTREKRAQKIESNMEGMDERIEEYYQEKHDAKPAKTFENLHKKLMSVKK